MCGHIVSSAEKETRLRQIKGATVNHVVSDDLLYSLCGAVFCEDPLCRNSSSFHERYCNYFWSDDTSGGRRVFVALDVRMELGVLGERRTLNCPEQVVPSSLPHAVETRIQKIDTRRACKTRWPYEGPVMSCKTPWQMS